MKNWEKILAKKDITIHSVLEILDKTAKQFVVIVDDNNRLIGTVTDGDIRRGLLAGVLIQEKVERVMNLKPITLLKSSSKKEIFKVMQKHGIHHLPLVDDHMIVSEIISLDELINVEKKENHVVLMAGGLGARLASLTAKCPKPMLKIGEKPILETIIETFKDHGFYKFIISVNYMSEVIEDYFKDGSEFGIEIKYLKENLRLGTAGALSLYDCNNGLPFIVMNGDLLTKINFTELLEFHQQRNNQATMCLRQYYHQIPFGVVTTHNDRISKIEEKPVRSYFVNGGIYVLNPEVISYIPKDVFFDMPTFFERLIELEKSVGAFPFYEYWIDIGRLDDYERAHSEFVEYFKK